MLGEIMNARAHLLQVVLIPPVGGSANSPLSAAVISVQNFYLALDCVYQKRSLYETNK
jgi:hypothetical protein